MCTNGKPYIVQCGLHSTEWWSWKTRDAFGKNGAKFWRNVIWGKIIGWHEWMHEMEDKEKSLNHLETQEQMKMMIWPSA